MTSAQDVLTALAMAERALGEIRPEPGEPDANRLRWMIAMLTESVAGIRELARALDLAQPNPECDRAVESVLAVSGNLLPPHIDLDPVPARLRRTEDLGAALNALRSAMSEPTTGPNE